VRRNIIVTAVVGLAVGLFVLAYAFLKPPAEPSVTGYLDGQEIKFFHTEVSDPKIAKILTDMISSQVFTVPSLANAPKTMLANVYVFANGVKDDGPLKFQHDVFDSAPGTPGYSPLRRIMLATWKAGTHPRILRSAAELKRADGKGELTVKDTGVVVNIPLLTWPGGHR
jgi:hypothetical protein